MPILMRTLMHGIVGNARSHRASRQRISAFSRRRDGRNEETWEGTQYVRPLIWAKMVMRKKYLR